MHLRYYVTICGAILVSLQVFAQNIVLNPSFENVSIPDLRCVWYLNSAQFTTAIEDWTYPTTGSTDVFNTAVDQTCYCHPLSTNSQRRGVQAPRTGDGMSSLYMKGTSYVCNPYREYLQGELSTTMSPGDTYEIKFYVSLADKSRYGTDNFGVKFTSAKLNINNGCAIAGGPDANYTGAPITDKNGWTEIILSYVPTVGGLKYFTIGNFYDNASTGFTDLNFGSQWAFYFVDDVSVINLSDLPISLGFFDVIKGGNRVEINWETISEENNEYFLVERTADGIGWTLIDSLPGAGTSLSPIEYRTYDDNPVSGTSYYRLKQVDTDGKASYSRVKSIEFNSLKPLIYPNPAHDNVSIELQNTIQTDVRLLDGRGNILKRIATKERMTNIDISEYAPGVYFIQTESTLGVTTNKLIIQ